MQRNFEARSHLWTMDHGARRYLECMHDRSAGTGVGPLPSVPEPQTVGLLIGGLVLLAWRVRRGGMQRLL